MTVESHSIEETKKVAKDFLNTIKKSDQALIIGLKGNLGSGKTTFVKAIAEHLGIEKTVSSPTFVIEKIYPIRKQNASRSSASNGTGKLENQDFKHLIHIDAYRLESGKELLTLGWQDLSKDFNNLIFIEWPENVSDILEEDVRYINFKFIDDSTREISYLSR